MEQARRFLTRWRLAAARRRPAFELANLLAAEAAERPSLARRLALLDALQAAAHPLPAAELLARVEARLGVDCWGSSPRRTLADDIRRLKAAGCQVHYARGAQPGYRWESAHGPLDRETLRRRIEPADAELVRELAQLSPAERLARAERLAQWTRALHAPPGEQP